MSLVLIMALTAGTWGLEPQLESQPVDSNDEREWLDGKCWGEWETAVGDVGGWRPWFAERGVEFAGSYIFDVSKVESGGVRRKTTGRSLLNIEAIFDLDRILEIPGGTVYGRFESQAGRDASETVGDAQAFSNIDSDNHHQLTELWYQQTAFDERLRIKIGKVDANTEFAGVDRGSEFLNSSMGFSPTIHPFPTYPDPATSVNVFYSLMPCKCITLGAGVYDGATQEGVPTGKRGPRTFYDDPSDLFVVGHATYEWKQKERGGRLAVGAWHHTGHFTKFNTGGRTSGTEGFFALVEQTVFESEGRVIDTFVQLGLADQDVAEIKRHVGVGIVGRGWIPKREHDSFGFGATEAVFSDRTGAGFTKEHETAYELYYRAQITPWFELQPDLQFIDNPGGMGVDDTWVGTLRATFTF